MILSRGNVLILAAWIGGPFFHLIIDWGAERAPYNGSITGCRRELESNSMPAGVSYTGPLNVLKTQSERYTVPGIVRVKPGEHCGYHSVSLDVIAQDSPETSIR